MLNCLKLLCWTKTSVDKNKKSRKEKKVQNITQEIIYSKKQTNKKKLIKEGGNIWQRNQEKREKTDIIIS